MSEITYKTGLIYSLERKRLASKVMKATGLTPDEKREIHKMLTGEEPKQPRRGRPRKDKRDIQLALEYLLRVHKGRSPNIKQLEEEFGFAPGSHAALYKALNKGIEQVEMLAASLLSKGIATNDAPRILALVEERKKKAGK